MSAASLITRVTVSTVLIASCSVPVLAQTTLRVVSKTGDELMKEIVRWQEPVYPTIARSAGAGGPVVVDLLIDEGGNVVSALIVSGHPLLQAAMFYAARRWKFKPAKVNNRPVRVTGRITYTFPGSEVSYNGKTLSQLELEVRQKPESSEAHYELGSAYFKSSLYGMAVAQLTEAVRINPRYEEAQLKLGHAYSKLASYQAALQVYTQATILNPSSSEGFHAMGLTLAQLERFEEAIMAFKRSLEIEPIITSYFMLGKCYWHLGQYDEAVAAYRQGLAKYPESDMGHFGLGETYRRQSKFPEAITEFQQAIKFSDGPGLSLTHYNLGLAYLESGDKAAAMKEYEILKQRDPVLAQQLRDEIRRAAKKSA